MTKRILPEVFPTSEVTFFCDEVGKGAWAHDMVACATYIDPEVAPRLIEFGVRDSKTFGDSKKSTAHQKRLAIANFIEKNADFAIGRATPKEIDDTNCLEANFLAICRAVWGLEEKLGIRADRIVIDGSLRVKGLSHPQTAIVKGDFKFVQIAAASVLAKVCRDSEMLALHEIYPWYGWDKNKGYGGVDKNGYSVHTEGMRSRGVVEGIHRLSFGDVGRFKRVEVETAA
jgi:ribonuclease HII